MLEVISPMVNKYVMKNNQSHKSFTHHFQVRFRDCDPAGIAFFANVFNWAHDTFEEFIQTAGVEWSHWFKSDKYLVPFKKVESEFFKPFYAGSTYSIRVTVDRLGQSSFTMKYDFLENETLHAQVLMTHVFIDASHKQKCDIPPNIREKLEPYLSPLQI